MSQSDFSKKIINEIIDIFSVFIEKTEYIFEFSIVKVSPFDLRKKFPCLKFFENKIISFETNDLYIYLIKKTYEFLGISHRIYFHSPYSILYFKRIIR